MSSLAYLHNFAALVAVGHTGSLVGASASLGVPLHTVSRRLAALEAWSGMPLCYRAGSGTRLTSQGEALFARMQPFMSAVEAAHAQAVCRGAEPGGLLAIAMPEDFGNSCVAPLLGTFARSDPDITLRLHLMPADADLSQVAVDLVLQAGAFTLRNWTARPLGHIRQSLFASPAYLMAAPVLAHPRDLARHDCILLRQPHSAASWRFQRGDENFLYKVAGRLSTNQVGMAQQLVGQALGVAALPHFFPRTSSDRFASVRVLTDWAMPSLPVLAWLPSPVLAPRTQRLLDFLAAHLALQCATRTLDGPADPAPDADFGIQVGAGTDRGGAEGKGPCVQNAAPIVSAGVGETVAAPLPTALPLASP